MPKFRGKYDHPTFVSKYPRNFLANKNFYYFMEDLARKKPEFAQQWRNIRKQHTLGHITTEQSNQQLWKAINKATN